MTWKTEFWSSANRNLGFATETLDRLGGIKCSRGPQKHLSDCLFVIQAALCRFTSSRLCILRHPRMPDPLICGLPGITRWNAGPRGRAVQLVTSRACCIPRYPDTPIRMTPAVGTPLRQRRRRWRNSVQTAGGNLILARVHAYSSPLLQRGGLDLLISWTKKTANGCSRHQTAGFPTQRGARCDEDHRSRTPGRPCPRKKSGSISTLQTNTFVFVEWISYARTVSQTKGL